MVMDCAGYSKEFDPTQIFRKILVPIDFTPESRRALIAACETRRRFGSEVHVFVTQDFGVTSGLRGLGVDWGHDDVIAESRERLLDFAKSICAGMPCLIRDAGFGNDVIGGVVDMAKKTGATMVMLGVHPKRGVFRTRAERIVKDLEIPVFVLKGTDSLPAPSDAAETATTAAAPSVN